MLYDSELDPRSGKQRDVLVVRKSHCKGQRGIMLRLNSSTVQGWGEKSVGNLGKDTTGVLCPVPTTFL